MRSQKVRHNCVTKHLTQHIDDEQGFPGGSMANNPPANAGDTGSVPDPGRFPLRREMETGSSILAWEIP